MSGRQWFIAIAGMIIVIPIAQFVGRSMAELHTEPNDQPVAKVPTFSQVEVIASRQPAEGVTEADFDTSFLTNLEAWTIERTAANAKKYWDAAAVPENERRISGESVFVERYGHRFAIVRTRMAGRTPNATIVGIKGDELIRIACIDRSGADVPIMDGPCDDKIRETFVDHESAN